MLDLAHPCMKESRADGLSCVNGWTKGGMLLSEAVPPRRRVPRRHCKSVKILQGHGFIGHKRKPYRRTSTTY